MSQTADLVPSGKLFSHFIVKSLQDTVSLDMATLTTLEEKEVVHLLQSVAWW